MTLLRKQHTQCTSERRTFSIATVMRLDASFEVSTAVRFTFFIWGDSHIEQGVTLVSKTAFSRYAWRDFFKPPKIDAVDRGNGRRSAHNFRSAERFIRIKR